MIIDWLVITITVITVLFLRGQIPFLLYITIYISISYVIYKENLHAHLSNWNWNNWNRLSRLLTFDYSLFTILYQALERPEQFVGYTAGILRDAEILVDLHGLEVRAVGAVVVARDRDVLSVVDLRIVLLGRLGQGFDEGKVIFVAELLAEHVATEHTGIALAGLGVAVATQLGFQIHAEVRVVVPEFLIVLFHFNKSVRECLGLTRGPLRPTGEVRLAYGPTLDHFPPSVGAANLINNDEN